MADSDKPSHPKPPTFPYNDWIGPVDKRSNLRKVQFAEPMDETDREAAYRKMRQQTYEWNHRFWAQQNKRFIHVQTTCGCVLCVIDNVPVVCSLGTWEAKEDFVEDTLVSREMNTTDSDGAKQNLSAEEMAAFYRTFLQDNRQVLKEYNREWYRRNFGLLWPAFRVAMDKVVRKLVR